MEKRAGLRPSNLELMCAVSLILLGVAYFGRNSEHIFVAAFGGQAILQVAYSVWCWRGTSTRARVWATRGFLAEVLVLGVFPGTGMMFISIASAGLADNFAGVAAVLGLLFFAGLFILAIGTFILPRWWGPGWYRAKRASEDD